MPNLSEVRYAIRFLIRTPAFSIPALASLALGIAVNAMMFSLMSATLLRPMSAPDASELVRIGRSVDGDDGPLLNAGLQNRGGNIRKIIAEQVLDKKLKALAIYGSIHCVKVGMGFPGELADKYPSRFWSVYGFFGDEAARRGKQAFGLGDEPAYVAVRGTRWEGTPASDMFPFRPTLTVGHMLDAVVWYGDTKDVVVPVDTTDLRKKYGAELDRRRRLMDEALKLQRR